MVGASVPTAAVQSTTLAVAAARAHCSGSQNYTTQWFGHQLKVNSCTVQSIIGYMAAGAGVATLAAIITSETGVGAIAGGVVAAILAIGGRVLTSCAANGTGVIIDVSWAGVPWCAAQ